jgi:hypothetical protein
VIASVHIGHEGYLSVDGAGSSQSAGVEYERVLAKCGFYAIKVDASTANLDLPVLASDPLQEAVRPLAYKISGSE